MKLAQATGLRTTGGLVFLALLSAQANAQNTSSVSSPGVDESEREIEYRFGWIPGEDNEGDSFAHRFDYGFSLSDRHAIKIIAQISDPAGRGPAFRSIGAEYLIELTPEAAAVWQSGVRFDASIARGAESGAIGVDWINRWHLSERVQARAMLVASRGWGDGSNDAIAFEARSSISYEFENGLEASLLAFNELGTTDDFGTDGLPQQVGPTISSSLGNGWSWTAGNLFGVSASAPDNDVRLWISRDF